MRMGYFNRLDLELEVKQNPIQLDLLFDNFRLVNQLTSFTNGDKSRLHGQIY